MSPGIASSKGLLTSVYRTPYTSPWISLSLLFLAWKCLLLLIALASPGPGYDTSSLILYASESPFPDQRHLNFHSLGPVDRLTLHLLRWDALYFVKAAQRGYLHEQEWAFSWAYTRFLGMLVPWFSQSATIPLRFYIWAGVVTSNICHYLSVLVLYRLVFTISDRREQSRLPFVTALLHILSPAGLFLSAPYTEAIFSLLNFSGMLFYSLSNTSRPQGQQTTLEDCYLLTSGTFFALATLMRSNGLLNGLIYLYDVAFLLPAIFTFRLDVSVLRRITVTSMAGILIAIGFVGPQLLAYHDFCVQSQHQEARPWCGNLLPSIYSWVQSNYWNVGFLRYWTWSNLPLFCLAAPMLCLLFYSSVTVLWPQYSNGSKGGPAAEVGHTRLPQLALPQLALAAMALTSFHVQIINRLCSGYPIWYVVIATWLTNEAASEGDRRQAIISQWAVRWIVVYAVIQGMLFASFLPPA